MHVFGENSDKEHIQESAACGFYTVQEDTKMGHGEKIISCLEDQFEFFGRRRFGHVQARAKGLALSCRSFVSRRTFASSARIDA